MAKAKQSKKNGLKKTARGQMTPANLTPFSFVGRVMEEMDRLAEDFGFGGGLLAAVDRNLSRGVWAPRVEMFQRNGELVLRADLPGLNKEDVKVEVANNAVTIEGERQGEHEEKGEGYYRAERHYGKFYRRLPLPQGVNADNATATFQNGVLEVIMPALKGESKAAHKLEIQEHAAPKSRAKAA